MPSGGYRPNAGRPKGRKTTPKDDATQAAAKQLAASQPETPAFSDAAEFLMHVVNNRKAKRDERMRAAIALLPFQRPRMADAAQTKKEARGQAAKDAGRGRYAPPPPPKLVVNNGG
jgi:phage terminase small subunit